MTLGPRVREDDGQRRRRWTARPPDGRREQSLADGEGAALPNGALSLSMSRLSKSDEMQGARSPRNETYFTYFAVTRGEVQRSRSRFYTAWICRILYSNVKDPAQYKDREKNRFPACGRKPKSFYFRVGRRPAACCACSLRRLTACCGRLPFFRPPLEAITNFLKSLEPYNQLP